MQEQGNPGPARVVTRDEALLWLADRVGKWVSAAVKLERGDYAVDVLGAEGELRHWSESEPMPLPLRRPEHADEMAGRYYVGGEAAALDLSLPAWAAIEIREMPPASELVVALGDDVWLSIVSPSRDDENVERGEQS